MKGYGHGAFSSFLLSILMIFSCVSDSAAIHVYILVNRLHSIDSIGQRDERYLFGNRVK